MVPGCGTRGVAIRVHENGLPHFKSRPAKRYPRYEECVQKFGECWSWMLVAVRRHTPSIVFLFSFCRATAFPLAAGRNSRLLELPADPLPATYQSKPRTFRRRCLSAFGLHACRGRRRLVPRIACIVARACLSLLFRCCIRPSLSSLPVLASGHLSRFSLTRPRPFCDGFFNLLPSCLGPPCTALPTPPFPPR